MLFLKLALTTPNYCSECPVKVIRGIGSEVPETGLEVDFQKSFWLRSRFPFWSRFPGSISISISISVVDLGFDLGFSFQSVSISISISVSGFDLNFDFSLLFAVASISISISVFDVL